MEQKKKQRESNIELLRIVAMLGVILLHYNNPLMGKGLACAEGWNRMILYGLESLFASAVNLFVLISGYFMCKNSGRTIAKPLELLIQVILLREGVYLVQILMGSQEFTGRGMLLHLIPANWFVLLYITLYLISPVINAAIDTCLQKKILKKVVLISLVLFSVYPTFVDVFQELVHNEIMGLSSIGAYGSQWGYTIVNFTLMYLIGAYIRNEKEQGKEDRMSHEILKLIFCIVLLTIWAYVNDRIGFGAERSAWSYCNPVVILVAVQLFRIFSKFKTGSVRIINELSKASFTVFLIHISLLPFANIEKYVTGNPVIMVLHIVVTTTLIYLICWCVYKIYETVTRPVYQMLYKAVPELRKNIYED